jgi:hypothetical protein
MLNNKEDYVLFFLIIILVSYMMMNKEKFTTSAPTSCPSGQKLCNGKCISVVQHCCSKGTRFCNQLGKCIDNKYHTNYC